MDCTWTLEGETFVLSYYTVQSPGTVKDGIVSIDYMGMGMIMTFEKTGETTSAPEETTEAVPEETADTATSGFGGTNSYQISEYATKIVTTVNVTLPEAMWVVDVPNYTLYLYNVESPDKAYSNSPRIQFETLESLDKINRYADSFENLVELESRVIGGIEMQGRSYKFVGMQWIEYYGELPNGVWMSVQVSKTSVDPGTEGSAILDSVTFE